MSVSESNIRFLKFWPSIAPSTWQWSHPVVRSYTALTLAGHLLAMWPICPHAKQHYVSPSLEVLVGVNPQQTFVCLSSSFTSWSFLLDSSCSGSHGLSWLKNPPCQLCSPTAALDCPGWSSCLCSNGPLVLPPQSMMRVSCPWDTSQSRRASFESSSQSLRLQSCPPWKWHDMSFCCRPCGMHPPTTALNVFSNSRMSQPDFQTWKHNSPSAVPSRNHSCPDFMPDAPEHVATFLIQ